MDLAKELISVSIYNLHPHYTGEELIPEVQLILKSLKIREPDDYLTLFSSSFATIVAKKIKTQLRQTRKKE